MGFNLGFKGLNTDNPLIPELNACSDLQKM